MTRSPAAPIPLAPPSARAHDHELTVTARDGAALYLSPPDPTAAGALDVLVETVCDLLEVDYAGVHVVEQDVHRVVASSDAVPQGPLPRTDTLCGVLLLRHIPERGATFRPLELIEVSDTALDPTLPVVTHGDGEVAPVRFYAAVPLVDDTGRPLGTLCVIAHHPRSLTGVERRTLLMLGVAASGLLARWRTLAGWADGQDG